MNQISLKALTLVAILAAAGLTVAANRDDETTLNQIAGYRQWFRVNREPVQVVATAVSTAVAADSPI